MLTFIHSDNNVVYNNNYSTNNYIQNIRCTYIDPLVVLIKDSDYFKRFYRDVTYQYDIVYFITKLLFDYDNQLYQDELIASRLSDIKSGLASFFTYYQPHDETEYKDLYHHNCLLFEDCRYLNYLKSFCGETDLRRQFMNILFYQNRYYSKMFCQHYTNINQCFNIESLAIEMINNDTTSNPSVSNLILAMLNSNADILSKLSLNNNNNNIKNDILNFMYSKCSVITFVEFIRYFGMLKDYFEVNEYNISLVRSSLSRYNSEDYMARLARDDRFQMSLAMASQLFGRFIWSEAELVQLITSRIDIDSRYKFISGLDGTVLMSEEIDQLMSKSLSFSDLESLAVVELYQSRSLTITDNLYTNILNKVPRHHLYSIFQTRVTPQYQQSVIKSLVYLYHLKQNIKFINLIFQYLCILSSLDKQFVVQVYNRYRDLFQLFFTKDNCNISIVNNNNKRSSAKRTSKSTTTSTTNTNVNANGNGNGNGNVQSDENSDNNNMYSHSSSYTYNVDYKLTDNFFVHTFKIRKDYWNSVASCLTQDNVAFIMENVFAERSSISSELVEFIMATSSPKDTINYCMTTVNARKFVVNDSSVTDNIEFLSLYLEELFKLKYDVIIAHPNQDILKELIFKTARHNPSFISKIQTLPLSNIITYIDDLEYLYKFFINNNNNNNRNNNICCSKQFNFMILKDIVMLLMFDKHIDTKWKMALSTVSKEFHQICSTVLSSYPVASLEIKSRIDVGRPYCLFKIPPLHLAITEIQFVPDEYKQVCLNSLQSLTQYFYSCIHEGSIVWELIGATDLRVLNIVQTSINKSIVNQQNSGRKLSKTTKQIITTHRCSGVTQNFDREGNFTGQVYPVNYGHGYGTDDWTFGQANHFMKSIVNHYNNAKLEVVKYVGTHNHKEDVIDHRATHYFHSLPMLNVLKHSMPTLHIDVNVPDCELDFEVNSEERSLITKFTNKYNQAPLRFGGPQQEQLLSLARFVHDYKKPPSNNIMQILNNAPNIRKYTIVNSLKEEHLQCLQSRDISTLVIKFTFDSSQQRKVPKKNITLADINRIFEILDRPEYQSIQLVKLTIELQFGPPNGNKVRSSMINQFHLTNNIINLQTFKPLDFSLCKFYR
ncbi:hypothetical protein PPL_08097 [Heterostelium album PN500]|uniref:Uncharacterized protein n=1 Tax=Heterostelium pallidum (strain ATCC 26659 / Pp 5 / PN500) TaxID=670386 RepID=D3BIL8_HETP5|nr:hypothetical protein PPL_08097 [Heterostelium album PN500]EFA78642.1 hypothetical protein PPL_08097 [Heterostelium album PN500]|eukprot:XP_020430766.1 hypothetical protein PPL_08097 [Heterostelium album PN500]